MANVNSELREKTLLLRRQHILEAAVKVFAERGFHRSTIRDVAIAAGVSDGAIYNVFANKQALLLQMLEPLGEIGDSSPPLAEDLSALMHGLLERRWSAFSPEVLPMLRIVLSEVLVNRELRHLFYERVIGPALSLPEPIFKSLADNGRLASADIPMTLRLITGSFLGLLLLRLMDDEILGTRANEIPNALANLLIYGLRPTVTGEVAHATN